MIIIARKIDTTVYQVTLVQEIAGSHEYAEFVCNKKELKEFKDEIKMLFPGTYSIAKPGGQTRRVKKVVSKIADLDL